MYQFQGGVSDEDQEKIIVDLQKRKFLKIESNNKVIYLDNNIWHNKSFLRTPQTARVRRIPR